MKIETPFTKMMNIQYPIIGAPMFLGGICFADMFSSSRNRGQALGANLFGALIGGSLQLLTFQFGIKALALVAALFYVSVLILSRYGAASESNCSETP